MPEATYHTPVLVDEVVRYLDAAPPGPLVDGTLGGGGHTTALLDRCAADRRVVGVDRDPEAVAHARARIGEGDPRFDTARGNFDQLADLLAGLGLSEVAGILLDLGVSSWQLDQPGRGFAFKHPDAPLDMRMDPSSGGETALDLIESRDIGELARVLREYGEVPKAGRVARALKQAVTAGELHTTGDLARIVETVQKTDSSGRHGGRARMGWGSRSGMRARRAGTNTAKGVHPATTVFQALRIAVNRELEALDAALAAAPALLVPGGRLAVIAYHSLEDRRVKHAFRSGERPPAVPRRLPPPPDWRPTWRVLTRKPVRPSDEEIAENPRSRSARLRVAERVGSAGPEEAASA